MNGWLPALIAFALMLIAGGSGALLARRLPEDFVSEPSMKNLRIGMALVGTMASLLLGLMINSARYTFSEAYLDVQKYAAAIQLTDQELLHYGGERACVIRGTLQTYMKQVIGGTWNPSNRSPNETTDPSLAALLQFHSEVRTLEASNDGQKRGHDTLLSLSRQLMEYHWKVSGEASSVTPTIFIAVVIGWYCLIFWYLGVFAPPNPVVFAGQVLAMVAISGAIFLVNEMGEPFSGPVKVSSAPLARLFERMEAEACPEDAAVLSPSSPSG
ncbi:DUF4239 domain-containing protein [Hyphomicrobium sp. 1Nfss2.1]|uniref:bestrophin-like domain n=1 Tax=Hyphomicrobium sp. 1Nfss2.1 TaxID=3413936 RepID=UPI003C7C1DC7